MSNQELETFLRRMDQDRLAYGESTIHVDFTPQGEVEVRRINPSNAAITDLNTEPTTMENYMTTLRNTHTMTGGLATEQDFRRYMEQLVQHRINQELGTVLYHGTSTYTYEYDSGIDVTDDHIKSRRATAHKSPIHNYNIREDRISTVENDIITLSVKTPTREYKIECAKLDYQLRLTQAKGGDFKNWEYGKV